MSRELFIISALAGGLAGWIATALFYTLMHGVFGFRGKRGPRGLQGLPGQPGSQGDCCRCRCKPPEQDGQWTTTTYGT